MFIQLVVSTELEMPCISRLLCNTGTSVKPKKLEYLPWIKGRQWNMLWEEMNGKLNKDKKKNLLDPEQMEIDLIYWKRVYLFVWGLKEHRSCWLPGNDKLELEYVRIWTLNCYNTALVKFPFYIKHFVTFQRIVIFPQNKILR